uniref:Uncharacterized protein n=1 Tax=Arundo donax TaxID=35708 RepID=A0A0A9HQ33_ARUDO
MPWVDMVTSPASRYEWGQRRGAIHPS